MTNTKSPQNYSRITRKSVFALVKNCAFACSSKNRLFSYCQTLPTASKKVTAFFFSPLENHLRQDERAISTQYLSKKLVNSFAGFRGMRCFLEKESALQVFEAWMSSSCTGRRKISHFTIEAIKRIYPFFWSIFSFFSAANLVKNGQKTRLRFLYLSIEIKRLQNVKNGIVFCLKNNALSGLNTLAHVYSKKQGQKRGSNTWIF